MALPIFAYLMKDVYNDRRLLISQGEFKKPDIEFTVEIDCEKFNDPYGPVNYGEQESVEGVDF